MSQIGQPFQAKAIADKAKLRMDPRDESIGQEYFLPSVTPPGRCYSYKGIAVKMLRTHGMSAITIYGAAGGTLQDRRS